MMFLVLVILSYFVFYPSLIFIVLPSFFAFYWIDKCFLFFLKSSAGLKTIDWISIFEMITLIFKMLYATLIVSCLKLYN